MFVREKKTKLSTKTAVQLVENIRKDGKVSQKIIRHFGNAINEEEVQALKYLALKYKQDLENSKKPQIFDDTSLLDKIHESSKKAKDEEELNVNLKNIREEKRLKVGFHQIYGSLFDEIGLFHSIDNWQRKEVSIRLLRDIIISRIEKPASKLSLVEYLSDHYGIKSNVNSVYRMMDFLDDQAIASMQEISYQHALGLLGGELDVIFYDCTTLYFESFAEDDFRQSGFSKDGKSQQDQLLLALMVSKQGIPVGYELFPGKTYEGDTLADSIQKLHDKYKIDKVIFVADAAMISEDNVKILRSNNQRFIVGARIKNQTKKIAEQILDFSDYRPLYPDNTQDDAVTYKEIRLENDLRLIVTYSPKRAAKDRHDREEAIDKAKKKLSKSKSVKSQMSNSGYKRFLSLKGDSQIELNETKIQEASRWDGLHGIESDIENLSVELLLAHYRGLWQVEETFRISKHDLQMRPIFHWNKQRIKAHIAICYMSLVLVRTLEYKVNLQYKKMSPERIRYSLSQLEMSILKDIRTGKQYTMPSIATQDAKKIYQILGYKWHEVPYEIK